MILGGTLWGLCIAVCVTLVLRCVVTGEVVFVCADSRVLRCFMLRWDRTRGGRPVLLTTGLESGMGRVYTCFVC